MSVPRRDLSVGAGPITGLTMADLRSELIHRGADTNGLKVVFSDRLPVLRAQELVLELSAGVLISTLTVAALQTAIISLGGSPSGTKPTLQGILRDLRRDEVYSPAPLAPGAILGAEPVAGAAAVAAVTVPAVAVAALTAASPTTATVAVTALAAAADGSPPGLAFKDGHAAPPAPGAGLEVLVSNPSVMIPSANFIAQVARSFPSLWRSVPTRNSSGEMSAGVLQLLVESGCSGAPDCAEVPLGSVLTLLAVDRLCHLLTPHLESFCVAEHTSSSLALAISKN